MIPPVVAIMSEEERPPAESKIGRAIKDQCKLDREMMGLMRVRKYRGQKKREGEKGVGRRREKESTSGTMKHHPQFFQTDDKKKRFDFLLQQTELFAHFMTGADKSAKSPVKPTAVSAPF